MAEFEPSKKTAEDFNGGYEYINGDGVITGDMINADAINGTIEGMLYAQDTADSAKAIAQNAKDLIERVIQGASVPPAIGLHHIQFSGEPTPAQIWAGTTWVIDTDYQGKTIIGSGGSYTLGNTGGEATHTLTINEMPSHNHTFGNWYQSAGGNADYPTGGSGTKVGTAPYLGMNNRGGGQAFNIMQPYSVVNYWKRTA